MQFRRNLPGRGSTDFYFTEESAGGMTTAQQEYIADLVMTYREKYPDLAVNAVWDFGMEEGDPVRGEKYGVFADSRDNAVYNASMLTISFNHARLRRMPLEIPEDEFTLISSCLSKYRDLPETASRMQADLLTKGVPWPKIDGMIRENLGITSEHLPDDELAAAVQAACLQETVDSFSKGYDTFVGERGVTLSGGQKQRAAIARTLTQQSPIMIFDDSLSAVDTETDARIRKALESRFGSASIILISHRITTLSKADQILVLDHGRIAELGTHEQLKSGGGIYQKICEIQSGSAEEVSA